MSKKITATLLLTVTSLSMCACNKAGTYKTSGKPYINREPDPYITDQIYYQTEEKQTDNFIAYKQDGELLLYPINKDKHYPYSPDGLCNVKSGKTYTITYDAQNIWGGVGGISERYFLTVYDCKECNPDNLFENGCGFFFDLKHDYPVGSGSEGTVFLAFKGPFGGYDIYSENNGKVHYSQEREIVFPLTVGNNTVDMQFNVFCNWYVSDKYIIDQILNREYENSKDFVLFSCYHKYYDSTSANDYDSIERLATGSRFGCNSYRFTSEEELPEGRMFITYEEIESSTAEDLGLDQDVFNCIRMGISDRSKGWHSVYNQDEGPAKKCDVLIFTGNFKRRAAISYDKDFKLYVSGVVTDPKEIDEYTFQYFIVFINSEFDDLFPQD